MSGGPTLLERPVEQPEPVDVDSSEPAADGRPRLDIGLSLLAAVATLLTATGLSRVFEGFSWWFLPCVGAVLTATACGLLGRLARLPLALLPFVYALGLAFYVPAVSAPDTRVGPLPTSASWSAFTDLLGVGAEDVRRLAVPVPNRPGLILLVVLGTYAVACAVDVICTRLRSPATAGLPLLALLAVPAAIVPGDVGLVPFLLGAVGYLLLLAVDGRRVVRQRAADGGSGGSGSVGGGTGGGRAPHGAPAGGRTPGTLRIGLIGLAAAVLLPMVLPGPGKGLITPNQNASPSLGDGGSGRARVVQPFVTLDQQLRSSEVVPLMHVHTDTPEYLRLTALELFDGSRFSLARLQADPQARVSNGLPPPAGSVRSTVATGQVRVEEVSRQRYLPVPYAATSVSVSGDWRLHPQTSTIFSGRTDTGGIHYSYTSQVPAPTAADLRNEPPPVTLPPDVSIDLRLPSIDPSVRDLARQLTASAPTTYDKVAAIQQYLRGPLFTYDLNGAPRSGRDALRDFLLGTRRGYCEQFASAMAVLVRAIHVPARVAIGFTPGSRDSHGDWVITNRDAHAWPEVWFPNEGWVRFEPTPRDDSAEVTPDYSVPPPPGSLNDGNSGSSAGEAPDTASQQLPGVLAPSETTPSAPDRALATHRADGRSWGWLIVGAAAVLGVAFLIVPALVRLTRRRRRLGSSDPAAAWLELSDTATDLGLGAMPTESPRAAGLRWSEAVADVDPDGHARSTLSGLARLAERARYAGSGWETMSRSAPDGSELARSAHTAVSALERATRNRDRVRAWVFPRSLTESFGSWWGGRRAALAAGMRLGRIRGSRSC